MSISATTMHMLRALGVASPVANPTVISVFTWDKSTADNSAHRTAIWLDSNDAAAPDTGFQFGTDGSDGYGVRIARGGTVEIFEETANYWWQGGNRNTWKGVAGGLNGPATAGDAFTFWETTERTKAQDITGGNINATLADIYVLRNRLAKTGWGGASDSTQPNLRKAGVAVWVGYKLTGSDMTALIAGAGANTIGTPGTLKYCWSFGESGGDNLVDKVSGVTLTPIGDAATVTWHNTDNPTAYMMEPTAQTVAEGATATFEVWAVSPTTPAYQWQREPAGGGGFTDISGATSRTYTGAATLAANNGDKFRCRLNPGGANIISRQVTLTVTGASVPVLSAPSGTVTSNTAATITHTTDTPGTGNTHYLRRTGGSAALAATIIATGESQATGGTGSQSRSVTLLGGTANQFIDSAQAGPSNVITVGPLSTATTLSSPTGAATGTTTATAGFTTDRAVSAAFPAYFLTLPAATAAPADAAALIANGATVSQTTGGTTPTRGITGLTAVTAYRTHMAQPGSNVVSSGSYTTSASGTAPTITVQPANQTVTAGATASFSVTATGSGLTYQWRRNGTPIGGATSASYSLSTVLGDNGAVFSVVVTGDTAPAATSSNATLTVNAAPTGPTLSAVATDATGSAKRLGQTTRMVVEPFTNIESLGTGTRTIATGTTDPTTGQITLTGLAAGAYAVYRFFPSTGATLSGVSFRLVVVP